MTISTAVTRVIVEGDGSTTVFSYAFPIVGSTSTDQTNADLWITDTNSVSTNLADNLWSMTGVVSITPINGTATGTFTYPLMGSPLAVGNFLTLERTQPYLQPTTLSAQGAYSPAVVEAALDNLALQTEQLNTWRLQSVRAPITDAALNDLPPAALRAGAFLRFDDNGQPSTASSTSGLPASIYVGTNSTSATLTTTLLTTGTAVTSVVTVAGVTTATINGGGGGGGYVFVAATTASSSSTVDITTGISDTYDDYELHIVNFVPSANAVSLNLQFSTNSGSTWVATGYQWSVVAYPSSGALVEDQADSATSIHLGDTGLWTLSGAKFSMKVYISGLRDSAAFKVAGAFINSFGNANANHSITGSVGGALRSATVVNGIRLSPDSGNIASGVARLYGYAKS